MKLIVFFAVVSVGVMVVMVAQVVRQEWIKMTLRALVEERAAEISVNERSITDLKVDMQGLKPQLLSMTKMKEEMKAKRDGALKEKNSLQEELNKCKEEKAAAEKRKTEATDNSAKEKKEHDQAKQSAQKTIQDLKQANLDREKAICALVDTTNAEARKLCGI